jgi:hypothetical protein
VFWTKILYATPESGIKIILLSLAGHSYPLQDDRIINNALSEAILLTNGGGVWEGKDCR